MNGSVIEAASTKKTVLILGINSFLGSNLAEFLKKDYRVVGTYRRRNYHIEGILTLPCDVLNKEEVQLVLYAFKPDFVLYCVGMSSLKEASERSNVCDALNTGGLYNVAELAPRYGSRIVYFSSQFVFPGINRNYNEMDNPDVVTTLGKSQASAEFYLQKSSLNYLLFRCCKLYGRGLAGTRETWLETLQRNIIKNISSNYDDYLHQGFIDIYYLGMVVKMCLDKNVSNRLVHFSSQDMMTHYEFAKLYCEIFQESDGLINKGKWQFPIAKGANIEKLEEHVYFKLDVLNVEGLLKIKMPTIKESLEFTYKRFHGSKHLNKARTTSSGDGITFI